MGSYQIVSSTGTSQFSGTQSTSNFGATVATFYPANQPSPNLSISPPAGYTAGQTFLMAATGGGTAGVASPNTPSGWTALATGGMAVFYKSATASESAYTVNFSAICAGAAIIASYPPSTVISTTPESSSTGVLTYTPGTFPSNVTSVESVECFIADIINSLGSTSPTFQQGGQTLDFPNTVWQTQVGPFGPGLNSNQPFAGVYYPVNIGLADVVGTASTPTVTSPISSNFYATFVVLQAIVAPLSAAGNIFATATVIIPSQGVSTLISTSTITDKLILSVVATLSGLSNTVNDTTEDTLVSSSGTGSLTAAPTIKAYSVISGTDAVNSVSVFSAAITLRGSTFIQPISGGIGLAFLSGTTTIIAANISTVQGITTLTGAGNLTAPANVVSQSTLSSAGAVNLQFVEVIPVTLSGSSNISTLSFSLISASGTVIAVPKLCYGQCGFIVR